MWLNEKDIIAVLSHDRFVSLTNKMTHWEVVVKDADGVPITMVDADLGRIVDSLGEKLLIKDAILLPETALCTDRVHEIRTRHRQRPIQTSPPIPIPQPPLAGTSQKTHREQPNESSTVLFWIMIGVAVVISIVAIAELVAVPDELTKKILRKL